MVGRMVRAGLKSFCFRACFGTTKVVSDIARF